MRSPIIRFTIKDSIPANTPEALSPWYRKTVRAVIVKGGKLVFSFMKNRDQYVLPGGGIDPDETPQECAVRECREELGLIITSSSPIAIVREFYNGILRFENLYVSGVLSGIRTATEHTEEEDSLGITEVWVPLERVQQTLLGTNAHPMPNEQQPEHVQRAIANCHMRELLGISAVLGWNHAPALESRCESEGISVVVDTIERL